MCNVTFEIVEPGYRRPLMMSGIISAVQCIGLGENLQKNSLRRNHNLSVFIPDLATMFYRHLPDPLISLPLCLLDQGIKLYVSIEVPFFDCALDILLNLSSTRVEVTPVWIGIKRKCLSPVSPLFN